MPIRNDMGEGRAFSPLVAGLFFSLALHALVFTVRMLSLPTPVDLTEPREPIEITQLPPQYYLPEKEAPKAKASAEQRIVETEDSGKKEVDPNAQFLSDRNQKALEQTRAKRIDDFRKGEGTGLSANTAKEGTIPPTGEEAQSPEGISDLEVPDGTGVAPSEKKAGVKRDWQTLSLKDLSVGGDGRAASASDDNLDEVATGERTILSTREFRYFSYYHRIKELLRQYWKPLVERKLTSLWGRGKSVSSEELVTRVLVLLDTQGRIQKVSKMSGSGVPDIDDAAVEAFQKAGPFPNPPAGIVEDDGFVRIRWDFILKTDTSPRIQFQSAGGAGRRSDPP